MIVSLAGGFAAVVVMLLYWVVREIEKLHTTVKQLAYDLEIERKKIIERRNY